MGDGGLMIAVAALVALVGIAANIATVATVRRPPRLTPTAAPSLVQRLIDEGAGCV